MNSKEVSKILNNPKFKLLVKKRKTIRFVMVFITLFIVLGFFLTWAFAPDFVSNRYPANSAVTVGTWMAISLVTLIVLISALYAVFFGNKLDKLNDELLKELGK